MTDEERYTFSSLMSLLIESERKLQKLYEMTAEETSRPELKSLLSDYGKKSLKRIDMMQKARIESVVEMTLEPVTLNLSELLAKINQRVKNEGATNLEEVVALERIISELYARTSPKIMQMSADTGELLAALSRESAEHERELERYVQ